MNNNTMNMLMQMINGENMNIMQMMNVFGGNSTFQQAQRMINGGGNPTDIIKNVAQQKGITEEQLKEMAQNFGINL